MIAPHIRVVLLIAVTFITACNHPQDTPSAPAWAWFERQTSIQFSESFTEEEKKTIVQDLFWLHMRIIQDAPGLFESKRQIIQWISDHIHYLLKNNDAIQLVNEKTGEVSRIVPNFIESYAHNLSYYLLVDKMKHSNREDWKFDFPSSEGSKPVPVIDLKIGTVVLFEGFWQENRLTRLSILLHEATHSSCKGTDPIDLAKMMAQVDSKDFEESTAAANRITSLLKQCAYAHAPCPHGTLIGENPPLTVIGLPKDANKLPHCDLEEDGPSARASAFLDKIEHFCINCSAAERTEANLLREGDYEILQGEHVLDPKVIRIHSLGFSFNIPPRYGLTDEMVEDQIEDCEAAGRHLRYVNVSKMNPTDEQQQKMKQCASSIREVKEAFQRGIFEAYSY